MRLNITRFFAILLLGVSLTGWSQEESDDSSSQRYQTTDLRFSGSQSTLDSETAIENWVTKDLVKQLGLGVGNSLQIVPLQQDINGHRVVRIDQHFKGIAVEGNSSALILGKDSQPLSILGKHRSYDSASSVTPSIGIDQALTSANHVIDTDYTSRLVFWPDENHQLVLSHEITGVFQSATSPGAQRAIVNATTGVVLKRLTLENTVLYRNINDFGAACRSLSVSGLLSLDELNRVVDHSRRNFSRGEGEPASSASSVNKLYDLAGKSYQFMQEILDLDSLDNDGTALNIFASARFYTRKGIYPLQCIGDEFNAMWNSGLQALIIPDAALTFYEVIAHELAHGIVSNGSELVYEFQSGALNEAIADAIGVSFRIWSESGGNPARLGSSAWVLREPGGIARNMASPKSVDPNYPDHYSEFLDWPKDKDKGGVHVNSSIINQAFYLLAAGGQHPRLGSGVSVSGIGYAKASKIYAQAAAHVLTPYADFSDARVAFASVAEMLFGGMHTKEWIAVHQSLDAVGIPGYWNKTPPPPPPEPEPEPESPPEPKPEPPPKPKPEPAPKEPVPEKEPSPPQPPSDEPEGDLKTKLLIILACLGLAIAAWAMIRMRPSYKDDQLSHVSEDQVNEARVKRPKRPAATPRKPQVYGWLKPLSGSEDLALSKALLQCEEGLVIGRAPELVHIELQSGLVSRRHVRLRLMGGLILVEDLNSSHGTEIDGKPIKTFSPTQISPGQLLRIAGFSYHLASKV